MLGPCGRARFSKQVSCLGDLDMCIDLLMEIGRFRGRRREFRRARRTTPVVWVQRLEERCLLSTAVTPFPIPVSGAISPLTPGPNFNLWYGRTVNSGGFMDRLLSGRIGRVTPTGEVFEYTLPAGGYPSSGFTLGPDGNLWFTETVDDPSGRSTKGYVDRVTPSGEISEFPLAPGSLPKSDLTIGTDRNLWCTVEVGNDGGPSTFDLIARVSPSGDIAEFPIPGGAVTTSNLTVGSDGNLWFAETFDGSLSPTVGSFVGRVNSSGLFSRFPIPDGGHADGDLIMASGGNLWFITQFDVELGSQTASAIDSVTPAGEISEYRLPSGGTILSGLTIDPSGLAFWFADTLYNSTGIPSAANIGLVTTSGTIAEFPLPEPAIIRNLTIGHDGYAWFPETVFPSSSRSFADIGRMTPAGVFSAFSLPDGVSIPRALILGPDDDFWYVGSISTSMDRTPGVIVGRIAPSGANSEVLVNDGLPTADGIAFLNPSQLTFNAGGNFWFTLTKTGFASATSSLPATVVALDRVHIAAFPDPQPVSPTVTGITRSGVHDQPTRVTLAFSTPLEEASAQDLQNYVIVVSNSRGRVHSRPLRFRHAVYDVVSNTVTLTTRHRLPIHGYYRVTVRGALTGANGAPLNGSGQPGSDYRALLHKYGTVTPTLVRKRSLHRVR